MTVLSVHAARYVPAGHMCFFFLSITTGAGRLGRWVSAPDMYEYNSKGPRHQTVVDGIPSLLERTAPLRYWIVAALTMINLIYSSTLSRYGMEAW